MMRISEGALHGPASRKLVEGDPLVEVTTGEEYHPDYQAVRYQAARVIRLSLATERNAHFSVEITRGVVASIIEQARREGWLKDASAPVAAEPPTRPKPGGSTLLPRMPSPGHSRRGE